MNYEEKFHTLLHMDEIVQLMHMRRYNQDRVCFIPNGEFLMLEIENLAERRPSIVIGDRIQASDPLGHTNEIYEGNVTKVGAKHVYLKFSELFHQMYNGEDYTIRVIPGRASYKRQHHAVFLISRNLGRNWLFPAKIEEKNAQIEFWYEPYPNIVNTNNSESANKRNVKLLVSLAKEIKIKKELEELNKNVLKLE
ncbi:probable RNA helicase armi, partial [Sitophilus oryzae]|uniref:Probable RNA helicase armi n=1 Tax=Sitophilus oryzae TaxID=7048 RepID=A0A6J2Y8D7_SITOR